MPFQIVRNDITRMPVDAIVNAANETLLGGGGVDGAIHRAAGMQLLEECRKLGGCRTGEAKATAAYRLPCRYVIHTVGPVWNGGKQGEEALLASCYRNSLALAKKLGCESIAFPLISAGAYGYPREQAMRVAMDVIRSFLDENEMLVYMVVYDKASLAVSEGLIADVLRYIDDNYVDEQESRYGWGRRNRYASMEELPPVMCRSAKLSLEDVLSEVDESFAQMLLRKIDEAGMTDPQCYKSANIDRKLFSKIRKNPEYHPDKGTALALGIALRLPLSEMQEFLAKAGYALSRSSKMDLTVKFCLECGDYDIFHINELLFGVVGKTLP